MRVNGISVPGEQAEEEGRGREDQSRVRDSGVLGLTRRIKGPWESHVVRVSPQQGKREREGFLRAAKRCERLLTFACKQSAKRWKGAGAGRLRRGRMSLPESFFISLPPNTVGEHENCLSLSLSRLLFPFLCARKAPL